MKIGKALTGALPNSCAAVARGAGRMMMAERPDEVLVAFESIAGSTRPLCPHLVARKNEFYGRIPQRLDRITPRRNGMNFIEPDFPS